MTENGATDLAAAGDDLGEDFAFVEEVRRILAEVIDKVAGPQDQTRRALNRAAFRILTMLDGDLIAMDGIRVVNADGKVISGDLADLFIEDERPILERLVHPRDDFF